jgi:hypothetical protein
VDAGGEGGVSEVQRKRARRRFHMSRTLDGMWVGDFLLDDEDGRTVQHAIETMRGNYRRHETRSPEQARADAFEPTKQCERRPKNARSPSWARRPSAG